MTMKTKTFGELKEGDLVYVVNNCLHFITYKIEGVKRTGNKVRFEGDSWGFEPTLPCDKDTHAYYYGSMGDDEVDLYFSTKDALVMFFMSRILDSCNENVSSIDCYNSECNDVVYSTARYSFIDIPTLCGVILQANYNKEDKVGYEFLQHTIKTLVDGNND